MLALMEKDMIGTKKQLLGFNQVATSKEAQIYGIGLNY
jgi:hypothetical protein